MYVLMEWFILYKNMLLHKVQLAVSDYSFDSATSYLYFNNLAETVTGFFIWY